MQSQILVEIISSIAGNGIWGLVLAFFMWQNNALVKQYLTISKEMLEVLKKNTSALDRVHFVIDKCAGPAR